MTERKIDEEQELEAIEERMYKRTSGCLQWVGLAAIIASGGFFSYKQHRELEGAQREIKDLQSKLEMVDSLKYRADANYERIQRLDIDYNNNRIRVDNGMAELRNMIIGIDCKNSPYECGS